MWPGVLRTHTHTQTHYETAEQKSDGTTVQWKTTNCHVSEHHCQDNNYLVRSRWRLFYFVKSQPCHSIPPWFLASQRTNLNLSSIQSYSLPCSSLPSTMRWKVSLTLANTQLKVFWLPAYGPWLLRCVGGSRGRLHPPCLGIPRGLLFFLFPRAGQPEGPVGIKDSTQASCTTACIRYCYCGWMRAGRREKKEGEDNQS